MRKHWVFLFTAVFLSSTKSLRAADDFGQVELIRETLKQFKEGLGHLSHSWVDDADELSSFEKKELKKTLSQMKVPPVDVTSSMVLIHTRPEIKIIVLDLKKGFLNVNGKIFKQDYTSSVYSNLIRFEKMFPSDQPVSFIDKTWNFVRSLLIPSAEAGIFGGLVSAAPHVIGYLLDRNKAGSGGGTTPLITSKPPAPAPQAPPPTTPPAPTTPPPAPTTTAPPEETSSEDISRLPTNEVPDPSQVPVLPSESSTEWFKACQKFAESLRLNFQLQAFSATCSTTINQANSDFENQANNMKAKCEEVRRALDALNQKADASLQDMREGNVEKAKALETNSYSLKHTMYAKNVELSKLEAFIDEREKSASGSLNSYKSQASQSCSLDMQALPAFTGAIDKKLAASQDPTSIPTAKREAKAAIARDSTANNSVAEQAHRWGLIGSQFDTSGQSPARALTVDE